MEDAYQPPKLFKAPEFSGEELEQLWKYVGDLTLEQLRPFLRQCGEKMSGNKDELVDRLKHLVVEETTRFSRFRRYPLGTSMTKLSPISGALSRPG